MRNEFWAKCARCGDELAPGEGIMYTRGHHSPYPVLHDSCMAEVDEEESDAAEWERDHHS